MMKTNIKQYRKSKKDMVDEDDHEVVLSLSDLASHDDVLTEIFLRLPIRSLLRSKSVSKHWRSIISDHRFSLLRNPNPNPARGLFLQRFAAGGPPEYDFVSFDCENKVKPPFKTLDLDVNVSNSGTLVLHSSNGLMLCHSLDECFNQKSNEIVYNSKYYVYNPTINQVTTLPKLEGCDQRRPRGMTLAFDPLKSPHYRVICVRGYMCNTSFLDTQVYSSETRTWKMIGVPFGNEIDTEFMGGVYWNNAVHWVNKKGYVLYIKLNGGHLYHIPTPIERHVWNVKHHCYPLVESRDSLLFIDISPPFSVKFDVYEMNQDYSGWTVKYNIELYDMALSLQVDGFFRPFRPAQAFVIHCLVLGEREEDSFLVLEIPGRVMRYNIESMTFKKLCDLESSWLFRFPVADDGFSKVGRWPGAFLFFESLCHV